MSKIFPAEYQEVAYREFGMIYAGVNALRYILADALLPELEDAEMGRALLERIAPRVAAISEAVERWQKAAEGEKA